MLAAVAAGMLAVALVGTAWPREAATGEPERGVSLGVVPQRDLDRNDLELMSESGADSVRSLFFWAGIEPQRGQYDWSRPDAGVRIAAQAGLRTLPFLASEPAWALEIDGYDCSERCGNYAPAGPATRGAYAQFAAAAVRRYGPDGSFWEEHPDLPYLPIRVWQIWNEQNSPFFFRPRADPYMYAALLERASAEIRKVDPGAGIVLGGVWSLEDRPSGVIGSARYLRDLYRVGDVADSFDGIAVHPYDGRVAGVLDQVRSLRRVARRAGDRGVGLWVTELGWAASGKAQEALVKGRNGQARMLERTFGRLLRRKDRLNLKGIYWYAWRDTEQGGAVCSWCAHAGLLSRSGRPRPAYDAMRALALGR